MFICILFNFFSNNYLVILCPRQDFLSNMNIPVRASSFISVPIIQRFMLRINQRMNIIQQLKDN